MSSPRANAGTVADRPFLDFEDPAFIACKRSKSTAAVGCSDKFTRLYALRRALFSGRPPSRFLSLFASPFPSDTCTSLTSISLSSEDSRLRLELVVAEGANPSSDSEGSPNWLPGKSDKFVSGDEPVLGLPSSPSTFQSALVFPEVNSSHSPAS